MLAIAAVCSYFDRLRRESSARDRSKGELSRDAASRNFLFTEFPGGGSLSGNRLPSSGH